MAEISAIYGQVEQVVFAKSYQILRVWQFETGAALVYQIPTDSPDLAGEPVRLEQRSDGNVTITVIDATDLPTVYQRDYNKWWRKSIFPSRRRKRSTPIHQVLGAALPAI